MKRFIPVIALALLSPFIAEILFGATPLSRVSSLLPLTLLYGGGAVLIREMARRLGPGWYRIALFAAAYALIEEGLVMQTLFSPDLFGAAACGARMAGVNWVWTQALIGYHVIWSIMIPIALVEIFFPERRAEPWLAYPGRIFALACYLVGALGIGLTFRRVITPDFRAPAALMGATAVIVVGLVLSAALIRPAARAPSTAIPGGTTPNPWLAALTAFAAAIAWLQLFDLPQSLRHGVVVLVPVSAEAIMALGFIVLLRRWAALGRDWNDLHRLAVIAGAMLASTLYGVNALTTASPFDRIGQALCGIAVFAFLALRVRRIHAMNRASASR